MMVQTEVVRKSIKRLEETLAILKHLRKYSLVSFITTPRYSGSAEQFHLIAIEAKPKIGGYIIADLRLGRLIGSATFQPSLLRRSTSQVNYARNGSV